MIHILLKGGLKGTSMHRFLFMAWSLSGEMTHHLMRELHKLCSFSNNSKGSLEKKNESVSSTMRPGFKSTIFRTQDKHTLQQRPTPERALIQFLKK
uniref:Uncharacterized protein n=1 Tax=Arion vulgaris TaxID=1028688 RepID=A0A0B7BQG8_9EUPU